MERTKEIQLGTNLFLERTAGEILNIRGTKNTIIKLEKEKMDALRELLGPLKDEFEDGKKFLLESGVTITLSSGINTDVKLMKEYLLSHDVPVETVEEAVKIAQKESERILIREGKVNVAP